MDKVQVSSKKVCKSSRDAEKEKRKKRKCRSSSSSSERSSSQKHRQKRKKNADSKIKDGNIDRKRVKRSRKHSSSSGSDTSSSSSSSTTSTSSSSSSSYRKNRKKKSKEKKHSKKKSKLKKQRKMKAKRKEKLRAVLANTEKMIAHNPPPPKIQIPKPVAQTVDEGLIGPDPKLLRAKSMAPMTKQEWEAKQSIIRRVYDEQTGRDRIIKGDGEILEEIVSLQRHKEINKKATEADGAYFLYSNRNLK